MPDIVTERGKTYGDPRPNLERTAALWSAILGTTVDAHQVALCMVAVKLSRAVAAPGHDDNYTDIAGYAEIARRLA